MATASQVRRINQRKIIRVMLRLRSASRTELAKAAGMSQPTVGRIVDDLMGQSILTERSAAVNGDGERGRPQRESASSMVGRPSTPLELDRRRRRFLAVQLGVYQTRMAALPMAVSHGDVWPVEFLTPDTPDRWAKSVLASRERVAPTSGIEAIVVSLPGVVDERKNRVLLSPNLRWIERADLVDILRPLAKAPVVFVQEIRALALGHLNAVPEVEDFLLVDIGSGVGAAAVIGGKLYNGPLPLSCELGHTPVVGNTRHCGCGAVGCVETLVSKHGFTTTSSENGGPRTWDRLMAEFPKTVPAWMKPSLDAAATTIAGALNVMGLKHVVLTGNITELPAAADYLCEAIPRGTMWARFGDTSCKIAPRRRMAGMVTAAIDRLFLTES